MAGAMDSLPQIIVGTYEEFVLGYKPKIKEDKEEELKLKLHQIFASHSHQASIRCIASHGRWLVSSGADEYINIYDMTTMKLSFVLNYHSATVTCLEFVPDGSYLVTAAQNGTIAIFKSCDWVLAKVWKDAHKTANGVINLSVHPSGGLMTSTGADNVLKFWNLIKARVAYTKNFSSKCTPGNCLNFVKWSKDGKHYAVGIGKKIEVYLTETANVVYEIECSVKATCLDFDMNGNLWIGTDEGGVELHKIETKELIFKESCHKNRIKCIQSFEMANTAEKSDKIKKWFVSADSKGIIKLWHVKKKKSKCSLELQAEVDVDCRITCMTVISPVEVKKEKAESSSAIAEAAENQNEVEEIDNSVVITNEIEKSKSNSEEKIPSNENSKKTKKNKKLRNKKLNKPVEENGNAKEQVQVVREKFIGKKRKRSLNESQGSTPVLKKKSKVDNYEIGEKLKKKKLLNTNSLKSKKKTGKWKIS